MLGNLRGSAVRARKNQIRSNADSSRQYLKSVNFNLEELARQEGHVARAMVLSVDFWIATKESVNNWLSEFNPDDQDTRLEVNDLATDFDLGDAVAHPPDPPPLRLPPAGLNLTPRLLPAPRPARS